MPKKFLRRTGDRYVRLGKGRKKKQVWRKPRGRDNKMREKRKGKPAVVSIGYKKRKDKPALIIQNIHDLENVKRDNIVILGKVGKKKKIEIAKKAREMKIQIHNLNVEQFLKKLEKKEKAKIEKETRDKEKKEKPKEKKKEIKEEKPKEEKK